MRVPEKASDGLGAFVESAKARDLSDDVIIGMLKVRGWPERRTLAALAAYYRTALDKPELRG